VECHVSVPDADLIHHPPLIQHRLALSASLLAALTFGILRATDRAMV
jgi:hypothetical protein